jgi:hypothetical protein
MPATESIREADHPGERLRSGACLKVGKEILAETVRVSWILFKILIPVIIAVKILQELGAVRYIGWALRPFMSLVGLPGSMGIVWATALLTNLYGGIGAFMTLASDNHLTAAQITVLACLMLVAHTFPVELRVVQKAGTRPLVMGLLRIVGALTLGGLLNFVYGHAGLLQYPAKPLWPMTPADASLWTWGQGQLMNLVRVFAIVLILMTLMKLLRWLKVLDWMERMLAPVLRILGMTPAATDITVIGMILGLGYGGGLIIDYTNSGRIGKRDVFFSLALMGFCHSLIEDTLLAAALGGHVSGILVGRILFALVGSYILVRLCMGPLAGAFDRYICRS